MKLANRVVVITGAASGIGQAAARRFADCGAILHLVDIDAAGVEAEAVACARRGTRAEAHVADCRDAAAMAEVAASVLERDAGIDVLFLNAGVGHGGPIADMDLADWRRVIDTNLYGVVYGLDAFLGPMLAQRGGGHVIITASVLGLFALPLAGAYAATKHALVALARALRAEVKSRGVEVTAICPGLVASNIIRDGRLGHGLVRARVEKIWRTRGADPDVVGRKVVAIARRRIGGVQVVAASGSALVHLNRLGPRTYDRVIGGAYRLAARALT
ncbi:MAG TPA: SDR family oxidoreductase [Kofleriaceae bacterium]|nr:SDR family oxidoreductase [Kofleriaceae bacterium]